MKEWTLVIFGACCFGWVIILLALALAKAAAPKNAAERARDDFEQMKALGYFDNVITSGSPVGVENVKTKKI